jgi:hypothetical protein
MPFNDAAHHCSGTSRLRATQVDGLAQGVILPVVSVSCEGADSALLLIRGLACFQKM